jgi:hypothetical protein
MLYLFNIAAPALRLLFALGVTTVLKWTGPERFLEVMGRPNV